MKYVAGYGVVERCFLGYQLLAARLRPNYTHLQGPYDPGDGLRLIVNPPSDPLGKITRTEIFAAFYQELKVLLQWRSLGK